MVCSVGNSKEMAGSNSHKHARLYRNIQPFYKERFVALRPWIRLEKGLSRFRLSTIFFKFRRNIVLFYAFNLP